MRGRTRGRRLGVLVAGLAAGSLLATGLATAEANQVTVTPANLVTPPDEPGPGEWVDHFTAGNATVSFVQGPAGQPLGAGSVQFTTGGPADKKYITNLDWAGTDLADIDGFDYHTWSDRATLAPVFQIRIFRTGTAGFSTVSYEPYRNGTVVTGEWQQWSLDPATSQVWLTGVAGEGSQAQPVTWNRLLEMFPDATIADAIALNVGSGWSGSFTGAADALTFDAGGNAVTFDFEPTISVADKDGCKNGGWEASNTPVFSNQGDCVSSFASQGKAGGKK